jgi:Fe2+ or Zn2+ uptake regulation protein
MQVTTDRTSKYIQEVRAYMERLGHATNNDLIDALRHHYPELSATTVHRITARMLRRGELQLAPSSLDNAMRFDTNVARHDHFMCSVCGILKDATLGEQVRPLLEQTIGDGCSISGSLTVSGICKNCRKEGV